MADTPVVPNVIIAGVTKAGTTSLFTYLGAHPDICASSIKEISHFVTYRFREPPRPLESYSQYFEHYAGERIRLESSPAYFLGGRELIDAIRANLPDVKVVLVLRDPTTRCISHFKFNKSMLRLARDMSFDEYIDKCEAMPYEAFRERDSYVYYGLASGCYANYLDDWRQAFGGRLYIGFFEELQQEPERFMASLCNWLEVDADFYKGFDFVVENQSRGFGNARLQGLALKLNKRFEPLLRRNIAVKRFLRGLYYRVNSAGKNRPTIDIDDAAKNRVRAYYAPHNLALRGQLLDAGVGHLPPWLRTPDE